jgi:tetratricopeptide (TPR) repeat protein
VTQAAPRELVLAEAARLVATRRWADAERAVRDGRRSAPDDPGMLRTLSVVLRLSGRSAAAEGVARRALVLDDSAASLIELARVLFVLRRWDEVARAADRVLADDPTGPAAIDAHVVAAEASVLGAEEPGGGLEQAREHVRRAVELDPLSFAALHSSGWIEMEADPAAAERWLRRALAVRPDDPTAVLFLASLRTTSPARRVSLARSVLAADPGHPKATKVLTSVVHDGVHRLGLLAVVASVSATAVGVVLPMSLVAVLGLVALAAAVLRLALLAREAGKGVPSSFTRRVVLAPGLQRRITLLNLAAPVVAALGLVLVVAAEGVLSPGVFVLAVAVLLSGAARRGTVERDEAGPVPRALKVQLEETQWAGLWRRALPFALGSVALYLVVLVLAWAGDGLVSGNALGYTALLSALAFLPFPVARLRQLRRAPFTAGPRGPRRAAVAPRLALAASVAVVVASLLVPFGSSAAEISERGFAPPWLASVPGGETLTALLPEYSVDDGDSPRPGEFVPRPLPTLELPTLEPTTEPAAGPSGSSDGQEAAR